MRPTIVGGDALAAEFQTPRLGALRSRSPGDGDDRELVPIGARLRLAAVSAGVGRVSLVGTRPTGAA